MHRHQLAGCSALLQWMYVMQCYTGLHSRSGCWQGVAQPCWRRTCCSCLLVWVEALLPALPVALLVERLPMELLPLSSASASMSASKAGPSVMASALRIDLRGRCTGPMSLSSGCHCCELQCSCRVVPGINLVAADNAWDAASSAGAQHPPDLHHAALVRGQAGDHVVRLAAQKEARLVQQQLQRAPVPRVRQARCQLRLACGGQGAGQSAGSVCAAQLRRVTGATGIGLWLSRRMQQQSQKLAPLHRHTPGEPLASAASLSCSSSSPPSCWAPSSAVALLLPGRLDALLPPLLPPAAALPTASSWGDAKTNCSGGTQAQPSCCSVMMRSACAAGGRRRRSQTGRGACIRQLSAQPCPAVPAPGQATSCWT